MVKIIFFKLEPNTQKNEWMSHIICPDQTTMNMCNNLQVSFARGLIESFPEIAVQTVPGTHHMVVDICKFLLP